MGVYYSHYIIPRDNTVCPTTERIVALIEALHKSGYVVTLPPFRSGQKVQRSVVPTSVTTDDAWAEFRRQNDEKVKVPASLFSKWLTRLTGHTPQVRLSPELKAVSFPLDEESLAALSSSGAVFRWQMNDFLKLGTVYPLSDVPDPAWASSYAIQVHLCDVFTNVIDRYSGCGKLNTLCICGQDLQCKTLGIHFDNTRIRRICQSCGQKFRPQDQIVELMEGATGTKFLQPGGLTYRFAIVVECGKDFPFGNDETPKDPRATEAFLQTCATALDTELYEVSCYE